ncbi:hypothetical protein DYB32_002264 [Aphanomyces invadans]|uniref:Carrier domain-containing protein n=1 Tax=Aphanomyces invadans TaxID=157072 RepID=A0A3R6Z2V4_9STRA|nr:hypothetical protein DYB32_002264 [Aphanomyces invadans]
MKRITDASRGSDVPLPYELVHHGFEVHAMKNPGLRAVEFDGEWLTYGELDAQANSVAAQLQDLGVTVGYRVAVIMERCLEFLVALLATHKTGASTIPMDATFPTARLSFMVSDADARIVLTTKPYVDKIKTLDPSIHLLSLDSSTMDRHAHAFVPRQFASRHDEAYIVYTSGSTGNPKGVRVKHVGIVNSVNYRSSDLGIAKGVRVMQFMAIGFDVCQWEIWTTLSHGATLVLRDRDGMESLSTVNVLAITPTGLSKLGKPSQYPNLKTVCVGGEAIPATLKDLWSPHVQLFNCYGPTEGSCTTHLHQLLPDDPVTIGLPISNVHSYILDEHQRHVPVGALGELYLGGVCVASGYTNLPIMTASRFLDDPFNLPDGKMYRTGDLVQMLPNGSVHYIGRQDSQVKLKGYRIELDEVANAMMQHPSVVSAAAVVQNKTHLVGYFSPAAVDVEALRQYVADQLPVYMVPAVWVGLDDMPQNSNGKIDVKALQAMDVRIRVEPLETDMELKMARVWSAVLGVTLSEIGRQSSFFELGGDSLSVVRVVAACKTMGLTLSGAQLTKEMLLCRAAKVATTHRRVDWPSAMLPDDMKGAIATEWPHVSNWSNCIVYPVTSLQMGMLYASMSHREAYVLQNVVPLADSAEVATFESGFRSLVRHHDILRTMFVTTSTGMYQVIQPDSHNADVSAVAAPSIDDFLQHDLARGFQVGDSSFVRLTVVRTDKGQHGVLTIHHCLYDGWSMSMLWSDLADIMEGRPLGHRPSFRHVVDYNEAQDKSATETFWRSYLSGVVPSPLGTNGHPLRSQTDNSDEPLSIDTTTNLSTLSKTAQTLHVSVAELVKFAWAATVRKYTRQNDVVFGHVVANRDLPVHDVDRYWCRHDQNLSEARSVSRILGPLVSTVPCRVQFDDALPLTAILDRIRQERGAVSSHSHASLIDMKRWSGVEGDLFDSLLVYQNVPTPGLARRRVQQPKKTMSTDHTIEIIATPTPTRMELLALYKPTLLSRTQAHWMLTEFDGTLSQICGEMNGTTLVSHLWTLSPAQTSLLRAASCGPDATLPFELLHHAFEDRARLRPHVRAVEFQDQWLSYGELDARANAVACELADLGVCVGSRVAVIMDRCLEFPIGLVATLKAGAAMMPLDVSFPAARLSFMVADAGACAVVTSDRHLQRLTEMNLGVPVIVANVTDPLNGKAFELTPCHRATKLDEAYIVYTSGSTGKPKGVPVLHHSAVNSMERFRDILQIKEGSRVFQLMAIGFDGFQADMWESLSFGATLVLRSEDDLTALSTADNLTCTPTALSLLGDPAQYPRLQVVAVAGEACPVALKDIWAPKVVLLNLYGPSECAIMSHGGRMTPADPITIGPVLPNVRCYVLDHNLRQVPFGTLGEFYLSGLCVSPGYINLPDSTDERFLVDPFGGGRMYKTGDLGRLHPNGQFEIAGRQDSQVKLKGYRIELDEVANAMMQHPSVVSAAAVVQNKTHLVGYFSPAAVDVEALRQYVSDQLPVYMVPAVWVGLDDMPQNSNGKIDVKALQAMDVRIRVEPLETDMELKMARVWSDVLGVTLSEIGRQSSFFELGGDSLSVVKVVRVCRVNGIRITVSQMVKCVTLVRAAAAAKSTCAVHDLVDSGNRALISKDKRYQLELQLPLEAVLPLATSYFQSGAISDSMTYDVVTNWSLYPQPGTTRLCRIFQDANRYVLVSQSIPDDEKLPSKNIDSKTVVLEQVSPTVTIMRCLFVVSQGLDLRTGIYVPLLHEALADWNLDLRPIPPPARLDAFCQHVRTLGYRNIQSHDADFSKLFRCAI